jgi:O-antigen/teichoic acid export membrane protein
VIARVLPIGWGFASQAFSSASSLLLTILAARALGPGGLGAVTLAFSLYLLALGLARSLVTEPLVAYTSSRSPSVVGSFTRHGLTLTLAFGLGAALVMGAASTSIPLPGGLQQALLAMAPWLVPALLQDLSRSLLFRSRRERCAALVDATWLATTIVALPLCIAVPSVWTVIAVWGVGACAGGTLGLSLLHVRPSRVADACSEWRRHCWPLGRWLGAEGVVYSLSLLALTYVILDVLGSAALGGLRAVQSVYAPLTVIVPALTLPGLPAASRALARSRRAALSTSARYTAVALCLTCAYVLVLVPVAGPVIVHVFGDDFREFESLALPIGLTQLLIAGALGFSLLLRAELRGRSIFVSRLAGAVASLTAVAPFCQLWGLEGASYSLVLGAAMSTFLLAWAGLSPGVERKGGTASRVARRPAGEGPHA